MKLKVFCANCQDETDHLVELDKWGETVLTCDCGRFIKAPKMAPKDLRAHLAAHKESNAGRVPLTPEEAAHAELLAKGDPEYLAALAKEFGG